METSETTYQLYKDIIGVRLPWIITAVEKEEKNRKITIRIEHGTNHKEQFINKLNNKIKCVTLFSSIIFGG